MTGNEPSGPEQALATRRIVVTGMTCDNCERRVEKILRGLRGVREVAVDRGSGAVTVTYAADQVDLTALHGALQKGGYPPARLIA